MFHVKHYIKKSRGGDFHTVSTLSGVRFRVPFDSNYLRSGTGIVPVQAFKTNLSGQRLILFLHQRCLRRHTRFSRINSRGLLNLSNNHQASLARIIGK